MVLWGIRYWEGGGGAMGGGLDTGEERGWPYGGIRYWEGEGVVLWGIRY